MDGAPGGHAAELGATTDLGELAERAARRCHAELRAALDAAAAVAGSEAAPSGAQEQLRDALQLAQARLLRLSVLVDAAGEGGTLEVALQEAQQCRWIESHAAHIIQCGDQMCQMRAEISAALATRQHDIDSAAALLCGGVLVRIGLPALAEDLVVSVGRPHVIWPLHPDLETTTRQRLVLEMSCRLAESSCCWDPERLCAEVHADELCLVAPGVFDLRVVYDLRCWTVVKVSMSAGCGHGVAVSLEGEEALRRHLQGVVDGVPQSGDAPAALCAAAHTLCGLLWLRILYDEATALSLVRRRELGSVWWDRRGSVLLRVCPDWEPTFSSFRDDVVAYDPVKGTTHRDSGSGLVLRSEDAVVRRGCLVELSTCSDGGIQVSSQPQLGLLPATPLTLEAGVPAFLERLLIDVHRALSLRHLEAICRSFVDAGRFTPHDLEVLDAWPMLRVNLRGCLLYLLMDAVGRTSIFSDGWSEKSADAAGDADERSLLARLEDARWQVLLSVVRRESLASGWTPCDEMGAQPLSPPCLHGRGGHGPTARVRNCWFRYKMQSLALFLTIRAEVVEPRLCILSTAELFSSAGSTLLQPSFQLSAPGLEPVRFEDREGGLATLRVCISDMFYTALRVVSALPLSSQVLGSVGQQVHAMLDARHGGSCEVSATLTERGVDFELSWSASAADSTAAKRSMPFISPLRASVDERLHRCTLRGTLRDMMPLLRPSVAHSGPASIPERSGNCEHSKDVDGLNVERFERENCICGSAEGGVLASGGLVFAEGPFRPWAWTERCSPLRISRNWQSVLNLSLVYTEKVRWHFLAADFQAVSYLVEFAVQAAEKEAGALLAARLEMCNPGRVRWRIPGLLGNGGEVFELVAQESSQETCKHALVAATDADSSAMDEVMGVSKPVPQCAFRWIEPRPSFLLAPQLSEHLCRTRDLYSTLRNIGNIAELVRLVEDLSKDGEWTSHCLKVSTIALEFRAMVGVELRSVAHGNITCRCLSRRKLKPNGRSLATLPSFKVFMRALAVDSDGRCEGKADDYSVWFAENTLRSRLAPLWDYMRVYNTLLHIYLSSKSEGSEASLRDAGGEADGDSGPTAGTAQGSDPVTWATLEWTQPALRIVCMLKLQTRRVAVATLAPSTARVAATGSPSEDPIPKRRRRSRLDRRSSSNCRTAGALGALEVFLCFCHQPFHVLNVPENDKARVSAVLRRFEGFLEKHLTCAATSRISRLQPVVELLRAPSLWMLEEVAYLLPPLSGATVESAVWKPMVEHFSLARRRGFTGSCAADRDAADGGRVFFWELRFVLASHTPGPDGRLVTHHFRCISGSDTASSARPGRAGGWVEVWVDDCTLREWLGSRLKKRAVQLGSPPYVLADRLGDILRELGGDS